MKAFAAGTAKRLVRFAIYGTVAIVLALVVTVVLILNSKADLNIWHTAHLDQEFTVESEIDTFEEYLALEDRLFAQLDKLVTSRIDPGDRTLLCRYFTESRAAPERWKRNWNRTFELTTDNPRAGFLLLHGMSDSPYSLRGIGELLHKTGAHVVGMRMPGHGTAPSGLVHATWEDMAAAVRIGVRHVRARIGDNPLFLIGYSNGGALAVHYAMSTIRSDALPRVEGLILLSPMIGVTPAAAYAIWQARIGRWLGLDKLGWNSVIPEIDPFKYQSFAVNAGDQTYRLTTELEEGLAGLAEAGRLDRFPPVLAISSAVDATVTVTSLIDGLMARLPEAGHELILFDVNRTAEVQHLLKNDPKSVLATHMQDAGEDFALTVITNADEQSRNVVEHHRPAGSSNMRKIPLDLEWPAELFSLGHLALPFSPTDPLYGGKYSRQSDHVQLGSAALRGERGVLRISAGDMLRIRWNPFYSYLERRILEFTKLAE